MRTSYKAFVSLVVGIFSLASIGSAAALTFNNGGAGCSVSETAPLRNAFSVNGNQATTTLEVDGPASCRETVSLASWNAAFGTAALRPFASQRFFAGETMTLTPGQHTLSIPIDNRCSYQVEAVLGNNQKSAAGDANYDPSVMMGFLMVESNVCQPPQVVTPTPTPPPAATPTVNNVCSGSVASTDSATGSQGGNCSTNNTTIVQASAAAAGGSGGGSSAASASAPPASASATAATPAAQVAATAPTSLVNTGPGSILAAFAAATVVGYFGYRRMLNRRLNS